MVNPEAASTAHAVPMRHCTMYAHMCAVDQDHHICPRSWFEHAGKPIATPMAALCPTCHMNVHAAIDGLLRGYDISAIPRRARRMAQQALDIARAQGLTPTPTL